MPPRDVQPGQFDAGSEIWLSWRPQDAVVLGSEPVIAADGDVQPWRVRRPISRLRHMSPRTPSRPGGRYSDGWSADFYTRVLTIAQLGPETVFGISYQASFKGGSHTEAS